jgi:hypothetical protein
MLEGLAIIQNFDPGWFQARLSDAANAVARGPRH